MGGSAYGGGSRGPGGMTRPYGRGYEGMGMGGMGGYNKPGIAPPGGPGGYGGTPGTPGGHSAGPSLGGPLPPYQGGPGNRGDEGLNYGYSKVPSRGNEGMGMGGMGPGNPMFMPGRGNEGMGGWNGISEAGGSGWMANRPSGNSGSGNIVGSALAMSGPSSSPVNLSGGWGAGPSNPYIPQNYDPSHGQQMTLPGRGFEGANPYIPPNYDPSKGQQFVGPGGGTSGMNFGNYKPIPFSHNMRPMGRGGFPGSGWR